MLQEHTQLPSIFSLDSMLSCDPSFKYYVIQPNAYPTNIYEPTPNIQVQQYYISSPQVCSNYPICKKVEKKHVSKENAAAFQKKGVWTHDEDVLLREAVKSANPIKWELIAEKIPGRNAIQCRERWRYRLDPKVDRSPFQDWEDQLIIRERNRIGNMWTLISKSLPGRTACAVKNRWYSVLRHRLNDEYISSP